MRFASSKRPPLVVYTESMVETRAFFKGRLFGREKLVVVVGRPRSLVIERGALFGSKKRIKVKRRC